MANLFGAMGLQDSDRLFNGTIGQRVIYDESQKYIDLYNRDIVAATAIFVAGRTDKYKERFKLAGGGFMQKRGRLSKPGAVKDNGQWDVAYPLLDYGDALAFDDISMAYMTAAEYTLGLQNIFNRDANTYRFELLKALFNNTGYTFKDELYGDLSVVPLANTDGTLYPPVLGATAEAEATYFVGSNYATASISDTNNPVKTTVDSLQARFGTPTGGSNIAFFYNVAEHAKLSALTSFVPVQYQYVQPGDNTATVRIPGIPDELLQGSWEVTGTCSGAVMCKWAQIPATYTAGVHLDATPPLIERVDPEDTGLGVGLQLIARDLDAFFESHYWRHRYGLAVRNRLNGYIMQMVASTTYTIPTVFA
ncbi:MAG: hypothetical protein JWN86_3614 [Planctomycetota bacterium]|nr:hypothetical protein [Planctomycetota bacterium]